MRLKNRKTQQKRREGHTKRLASQTACVLFLFVSRFFVIFTGMITDVVFTILEMAMNAKVPCFINQNNSVNEITNIL